LKKNFIIRLNLKKNFYHKIKFEEKYIKHQNATMISKKYEPFELNEDNCEIVVPKKYEDAFLDDDRSLTIHVSHYEDYRQLLCSYTWMENWYNGQPWTINSYPISRLLNNDFVRGPLREELDEKTGFFVRLNSVSPKDVSDCKAHDLNEAIGLVLHSPRCRDVIKMSKEIDRPVILYGRQWKNMDGNEFRVFVFEMEIVAISSIDEKPCGIKKEEIIKRCQALLELCKFSLPLPDVCMDVLLGKEDFVIEFNSYGPWGNSSAELFDWKTDRIQLMGFMKDIEVRLFDTEST
jgi:hypothetical protein